MTPVVITLVFTAALLHAVWNAMMKSGGSPEFSVAAFQLVGGLICLALVSLVPPPDRASWPLILASVVIHNAYYLTLAQAYRAGDLSQVYPLFRGLAPVMVAVGAALAAGEWLSPGIWIGVVLVSMGVSSLALFGGTFGRMSRQSVFWGLTTSILIALYTVVDGLGVRTAGNSLSYILWLNVFEGIPIICVLLLFRKSAWFSYIKGNAAGVIAGGIAASTAYGLVMFAMSLGAMAVVSSLRETSVIFAAIIGSVFLREPFGAARIRAAILVAAGIILMKLLG